MAPSNKARLRAAELRLRAMLEISPRLTARPLAAATIARAMAAQRAFYEMAAPLRAKALPGESAIDAVTRLGLLNRVS
jgi:hypothetical protein